MAVAEEGNTVTQCTFPGASTCRHSAQACLCVTLMHLHAARPSRPHTTLTLDVCSSLSNSGDPARLRLGLKPEGPPCVGCAPNMLLMNAGWAMVLGKGV